jgi:hypothetical protein
VQCNWQAVAPTAAAVCALPDTAWLLMQWATHRAGTAAATGHNRLSNTDWASNSCCSCHGPAATTPLSMGLHSPRIAPARSLYRVCLVPPCSCRDASRMLQHETAAVAAAAAGQHSTHRMGRQWMAELSGPHPCGQPDWSCDIGTAAAAIKVTVTCDSLRQLRMKLAIWLAACIVRSVCPGCVPVVPGHCCANHKCNDAARPCEHGKGPGQGGVGSWCGDGGGQMVACMVPVAYRGHRQTAQPTGRERRKSVVRFAAMGSVDDRN